MVWIIGHLNRQKLFHGDLEHGAMGWRGYIVSDFIWIDGIAL
jgi:hypothetical protein